MNDEPHTPRQNAGQMSTNADILGKFPPMGTLKNGNPSGNPNNAPRCAAKKKRTGEPCKAPAMKNGKCRMHGGASTGPKTEEGLNKSRKARWKHGEYSKRAIKLQDDYLWLDGELIKRKHAIEAEELEHQSVIARLYRRLTRR